jgi:hypothetical protein
VVLISQRPQSQRSIILVRRRVDRRTGRFRQLAHPRSGGLDTLVVQGRLQKRGLSPTGSGREQVDPLTFAGFLVILASLRFLVLFDWKRGKEMPMRKAFMYGVRSVSETFWTIGASSITAI